MTFEFDLNYSVMTKKILLNQISDYFTLALTVVFPPWRPAAFAENLSAITINGSIGLIGTIPVSHTKNLSEF